MQRNNDKYCQTSIHRGQICLPLLTSHEMMTIAGTLSIITRAQMHQFDSEVWFVYVILLRLTRSVVMTILLFFFLFSPSQYTVYVSYVNVSGPILDLRKRIISKFLPIDRV